MAKKKIGLVGEDWNDKESVKNILGRKFRSHQFLHFLKHVGDTQLGGPKAARMLRVEFGSEAPSVVVFIRDLDGFETDHKKVQALQNYFDACNRTVEGKGLFLRNVQSIEALIFSDIETFNRIYGCVHRFKGDPTRIVQPKNRLKRLTKSLPNKYHENDNPEIFKKLNPDTVMQRCAYFREFVQELDRRLSPGR
jgi:hypothetical protein